MGGGPPKDALLCALPFPEPAPITARLRQRFPHLELVYITITYNPDWTHALPNEIPVELWQRVVVLCTLFTVPDPAEAPRLQWVHLVSAGSNQLHTTPLYRDTEVPITTSSGIHGPQIAEWAVLTALVVSRRYHAFHELQQKHQWGASEVAGELRSVRDWVGRRVGVLGYGSIGRQVGRVMKAMGAEIIAFTATPKDTPEQRRDGGFIVPGTGDAAGEVPSEWYSGLAKAQLHEFLRQDLDWLLVAVPLTEQTRHFLSTEEFRVLSHDGARPAFVTNIARGAIIDQPALIEALKDGTLSGAALDVTDPEPLPSDSELWDLPNVVITPHVSGSGVSYLERTFQVLEINLERRQKGEEMLNVVQRSRGY